MTLKTNKPGRKTIFLLLFSFIVSMSSFAQVTNSGRNFFVTFGKNNGVTCASNDNVDLILRVTAANDTKVTFSFTENSSLNETITIPAGTIKDYYLSPSQAIACYSGSTAFAKDQKSIQVTASEPITLVAVNSSNHSAEATLVLPVDKLKTEYVHIDTERYNGGDSNGYLLVATEDNTQVTQETWVPGMGTFTTNLNKGDVYFYHYYVDNTFWMPEDTRIVSNKPIAYFPTQHEEYSR